MNKKFLYSAILVLSIFIGRGLILNAEQVKASPPIILSPLEFPKKEIVKSVEYINVNVDWETQNVSVTGATEAIVDVTTSGKITPKVIYKKVIQEKVVKTGYPFTKAIYNTELEGPGLNFQTNALPNSLPIGKR